MNNIHNLIERFKQLRERFSLFDNNDNAYDFKKLTAYHKPLIEKLQQISHNIKWLVPIVQNKKRIYNESTLINGIDYEVDTNYNLVNGIIDIQDQYKNLNRINYLNAQLQLNDTLRPFDTYDDYNCLQTENVNTNLDAIIDNFGDF